MTSTNIQDFFQQNTDICDCGQRCTKCGKLIRQQLTTYTPYYPNYPPIDPNPFKPWITYTVTTTPSCTHQE